MSSDKKSILWDLPVRLSHLAMIVLVGLSWYTAENMHVFAFGPQDGPSDFDIHVWSGIALLVVVLFRILWGVFGSTTARFSQFLKGPRAVLNYIRGQTDAGFGHNPLGGLSVVTLIALLLIQPLIGLTSSEDTFGLEGPLKHLVSTETSYWLASIHKIIFNVLLVFISLHLCAILYYRVIRKDKIISPIITGRSEKDAPEGLVIQPVWCALIFLAAAATIIWAALAFFEK